MLNTWSGKPLTVWTSVDTESLSVRARIALLQGDLDHDKAVQAAGKVRDYLAVY